MPNIRQNTALKVFNTFGIEANASHYVPVTSVNQLEKALGFAESHHLNTMILGGGSNLLLTKDYEGLVIHIKNQGKTIVSQSDDDVLVKVQAGEHWHDFVMWSLAQGYGGLENLALIPGTVGASPVQNIGAYGVEAKDVIVSVEVYDRLNKTLCELTNEACQFGYRDSVFKRNKGKYVVLSVTFKLSLKLLEVSTDYGAINDFLKRHQIEKPQPIDVANAVIDIRESKLPDPKDLGNSGSFFKNPVVAREQFLALQSANPKIPFYELTATDSGINNYKIPAGWLIEQAGFKGKRIGDAGVHSKQALVLVNYGNATGKEILNLAETIKAEVQDKFGITLEFEVNIV